MPERPRQIETISRRILDQSPDPAVRWRLLRDVLRVDSNFPPASEAYRSLLQSRQTRALAAAQQRNGGWGRFHSQDSTLHRKFPTTEFAVARALALGLAPTGRILAKTAEYIGAMLTDDIPFPDPAEMNDRWPVGVRLFLAATLARLQPGHPLLNPERSLWLGILRRTFHRGTYDPKEEQRAHLDTTGARVKNSYLVLDNRYMLDLLGSEPGLLPPDLEAVFLGWLWSRVGGIGYLGAPLTCPPPSSPGPFERWLTTLELFAGTKLDWAVHAVQAIEWLWDQCGPDGYWDFGTRSALSAALPLSNSWRRRQNRVIDWSTRILILLKKYEIAIGEI